uniref:F-box associated beta-propeller type 3 domain-containing protein n=1 Tax=Aegilops tauschii TaxID=37682 RepID=N1QVP2_AEGTA
MDAGAAQFALNYHCQKWDRAYSFAYHPTSGQYKVVHVPCSFDRVCDYDAAHVLTLGEAAWREVPDSNGKRCNLHAGIVSVDGVTYWVTDGGTARIVSLDLDDEHVASSTMALPSLPDKPDDYNLTEVDGRLGVVLRSPSGTREAWVRDKGKWICRYVLRCKWQQIPRPYFAHGEYFLKFEGRLLLYVYSRKSGVVKVSRKDEGRLVAKMKDDSYGSNYQTFAYVKTSEPLGVYDGTK